MFLRNILVFTVVYLPFLVEIRVVNMDQQRIQIVYEGIFLVNRYLKNEEWLANLKRETTWSLRAVPVVVHYVLHTKT